MPDDMLDEFGPGKCEEFVGRLRKELYGRHNAARAFSREVLLYVQTMQEEGDMDIRIFTSDRCVISFQWQGGYLIILLHVDDGLRWFTSPVIRDEVTRRLSRRFIVSVSDVDVYCGIRIRHDSERRLLRLDQTQHIDLLLETWGGPGLRPQRQPAPGGIAGAAAQQQWSGNPTPREQFDYAMFVGDVVWLLQTRKDIARAVQSLAQHIRCPGPAHVQAALHLLRYLKETRDDSLTFDGSDSALTVGWDRRNKLIHEFDASLPLPCTTGITGISCFINGAVIKTTSRRQKSISRHACEAETKAGQHAGEDNTGLQELLGEFLQLWPGASLLRGDCRGVSTQINRNTDKASQAAYKRCIASLANTVNTGRAFLDLIPREHNSGDNGAQLATGYADWKRRRDHQMGIVPHVYVSDMIRNIQKRDRMLRSRAAAAIIQSRSTWWNDPD